LTGARAAATVGAPWRCEMVERRISRRGFLRIGGTALAGGLGGAPASWAARELGHPDRRELRADL
jgi:hypothetical protein